MALLLRPLKCSLLTPRQGTSHLCSPSRFRRFSRTRSSLPFPPEKSSYYKQLEAAVDVVERACRLCVDVSNSLLLDDAGSLEKKDSSPVTVADFAVQALISLELGRLFPSIPLVAEEDSSFLRSRLRDGNGSGDQLVKSVVCEVTKNTRDDFTASLTYSDVLEAIDRGVQYDFVRDEKGSMYWILDPIDGTRGFLKGGDALYVVGLALVVQGGIAIGVMGCPNWKNRSKGAENSELFEDRGLIMISHVGCGTWARKISPTCGITKIPTDWQRYSVDQCSSVQRACFCISDSQIWDSLPLYRKFGAYTDVESYKDTMDVLIKPTCCGSLCKYFMVATGIASVFILQAKADASVKVWDHAIGILCVHEAGGQVTDWEGNQLNLAADQARRRTMSLSGGVLATNGALHPQMLELISSNWKHS